MCRQLASLLALFSIAPVAVAAQSPPCLPCGGLAVDSPAALIEALEATPRIGPGERLYVAWPVALDGTAETALADAVAAAGGTPWLRLQFRTAAPLAVHLDRLDEELAAVVDLIREAPGSTHVQIEWLPEGQQADAWADYRFLLRRAAVAIDGVREGVRVIAGPIAADPDRIEAFYDDEIGAYFEGLALAPPLDGLAASLRSVEARDPGKPVVVFAARQPAAPETVLAVAAAHAAAGAPMTFFAADRPLPMIPALKLLAREFAGDLSFDPHTPPEGALSGWSFVRGEDLGLRIVVAPRNPQADAVEVRLPDPTLRSPERVRLDGQEPAPLFGLRSTPAATVIDVPDPDHAFVLRLARTGVGEIEGLEGVEAEVHVAGEREIPVEEILRRLQAFEDAQARRLRHLQARNTTHMRFQPAGAGQTVEATFAGPYFVDEEGRVDWAWRDFHINGVRWRGKRIPELPLIQPEKAAAQPLEIRFSRDYRYRLRGTATVAGRDCWVVEFVPAAAREEGRLYRGTVWIDRRLHSRVRVRAVQLGLTGDVVSNQERFDYRPVDGDGQAVPWEEAAYILPVYSVSHQTYSVLNTTLAVERESELTELQLNDDGFAAARRAAHGSAATMVRDTDAGLRYLVKDGDAEERVVQVGFDTNRLFVLGGVFHDDSLDFPLPLAGINYLDFDFRGSGAQLNVFFAGVLVNATLSDPSFLGSRFDAGVDVFGLAIRTADNLFRDGDEILAEELEQLGPSVELRIGHPVGTFGKLKAGYRLTYRDFGRADETGEAFRLPSDHLEHAASLTARYNRAGYRLRASGSRHERSAWEQWGMPDGPFDPNSKRFTKWRAGIAKDFNLPTFQRISAEVEYLGGKRLDRFSKYGFGLSSDSQVHGYQIGKVRAEEAIATHLIYGFRVSEHLRLDLVGDAAWASDEESGLDRELLAGVGVVGQLMGPWETLIQLDVGVPVAGPEDGFVAFIAVLKLWR